jgi:hypothetical protein
LEQVIITGRKFKADELQSYSDFGGLFIKRDDPNIKIYKVNRIVYTAKKKCLYVLIYDTSNPNKLDIVTLKSLWDDWVGGDGLPIGKITKIKKSQLTF